jgi:PAS domain S-box-containing protein
MRENAQVDVASIVDAAPVLLALVDRDGRVEWCNREWLEFTGWEAPNLVAARWVDAVVDDDVGVLRRAIDRARPFALDIRMRSADGRARWMATHGAPRGHGQFVFSAIDVTASHETERVLQLLAAVGDALNASLEVDEILQGVARVLVRDVADLCTIAVVDDHARIRRVAVAHQNRATEQELASLRGAVLETDESSAIAQVVRTGAVLYRPVVDAPGPDEPWPGPDESDATQGRSLVSAPLRTRDGIIGALTLVSWARRFGPDDVDLAQEVARRCASAVDNAVLYRRSEETRARLSLVANVGEHLAATTDLDAVAQTLARRVVPVLADAASVALISDDGRTLRRRAFCHIDPKIEEQFRDGPYSMPIPLDGTDPQARAARSMRPVLIEDYGARPPRSRQRDNAFRAAAKLLRPTSVLAVPLLTDEHATGVLTLAFTNGPRRYSAADLPLALDIARRGALAIERARAFAKEQHIAEALQHSMLPEALPDVAGVSICARYLPGGESDVGGDWYDVVPLSKARFGVAIGDVAGHGVRAAAVMGQLRHALRAFASDDRDAAAVVARLNRFVFEQGPLDMATLCYGILDPAHGRVELAAAGHVPPLLIDTNGDARFVDVLPAPPLGADPLSRYRAAVLDLDPGATLLMYTDGLVERRGEALDAGLERVLDAARKAPAPLDDVCDHLITELVGGRHPADDVAMLALRYVGAARGHMRVRRPARAAELAPVRRILSSWLESAGITAEDIGSIAVATSEAATNAIEHAYGPAEGWFEVEADVDDAHVVTLTVRDAGRWRPKARGGGGRGLLLIGRLMDEFEVRRRPAGTEVWMRRAPRGEKLFT